MAPALRGVVGSRAAVPPVLAKDAKLTGMCIYMHETLIMSREMGINGNILLVNGVIS